MDVSCDGCNISQRLLGGKPQKQNPLLGYILVREGGRGGYWVKTLFATAGRALPIFPLMIYTAYSLGVVVFCVLGIEGFSSINLEVLSSLMNMVGTSLFLLQAFRVNSSYDRWWEGRKLWDQIQASAADLGRMSMGWVMHDNMRVAMLHWILGFAVAARDQLRHTHNLGVMAGMLPPAEMQRWVSARSKPKYAALMMTLIIRKAQERNVLSSSLSSSMDARVSTMLNALGSCSRIKHTPMPFAYIVHLRSFLVLWLLVLPWSFVQTLGWWTTPASIVLGYQLLGFEEIGVEIESPFGAKLNQLDLDNIVEDIHNDVRNKLNLLEDVNYASIFADQL